MIVAVLKDSKVLSKSINMICHLKKVLVLYSIKEITFELYTVCSAKNIESWTLSIYYLSTAASLYRKYSTRGYRTRQIIRGGKLSRLDAEFTIRWKTFAVK